MWYYCRMHYKVTKYKNIKVSYLPSLDGGGMGFGQEYLRVIKERIGKVGHVFEYCSGPGFIGFSLLANGLCDKLTLADVNPNACAVCNETVKNNKLEDRVSVYLSDCLDSIPETEKWDLVVSNPPHWPSSNEKYPEDIKMYDPNLIIHKKFYQDIHKFLTPNGTNLIQENGRATKSEDFIHMIEDSGLEIIDIFKAKPLTPMQCILQGKKIRKFTKPSPFYFIWSKVKK